jgi:hypothetical protein
MKLTTLILMGVGVGLLSADPVQPKVGSDLGTITTTDGKTYTGAKLAGVEPTCISILDSDGGAKISFDKLPQNLREEFGYDPTKAALYAQQQYYEAEIAQLKAELSRYKSATENAAPTNQVHSPQPTIAGFHYFFFELKSQSSGFENSQNSSVQRFQGGSFAGLTREQAEADTHTRWEAMTLSDKMAYEQKAQAYGDPIVKEEEAEREARMAPHINVQVQ